MKNVLIKVVNVKKSFLKKVILENVNFEIEEGKIVGLLGFSGSGKTTLLNIICGFYRPDSGDVLYHIKKNDKEEYTSVMDLSEKFKSHIGFSTQRTSLYPELSVIENLKYFASLYSIKKDVAGTRIKELLNKFDLEGYEKYLSKNLSEGMKKRLDIACALIHNPKILILDEPTVNLDFKLAEEFLTYIKNINKEGITIIFISHLIDELQNICDEVVLISKTSHVVSAKGNIKSKFNHFAAHHKIKQVILNENIANNS